MLFSLVVAPFALIMGGDQRPANGCGHVPYSYEIGVGEVSNRDYAEFLNAVAKVSDPHRLYSPLMTAHFWGGIVRVSRNGGFEYTPKRHYEDLPVTFVSFADAARFANWLSYGKPARSSTEGNRSAGSYDTTRRIPVRNRQANYVVPSCDEWAKAAYFDRSAGRFSLWATAVPTRSRPRGPDRSGANVSSGLGFANPFPHLVGADAYRPGPSGKRNQAGNALEWTESRAKGSMRIMGGSLFMNVAATKATYRDGEHPDHELSTLGFRVARLRGSTILPDEPNNAAPKAAIPAERFKTAVSEFVRVAAPGNEPDPITGAGAVAYQFDIQRTEISNGAYADFLNAVTAKGDPAGLFRKDMQWGVGGGIESLGSPGDWRYRAKTGWSDRAVAYISWFALARMANWRHNGSLRSGKSDRRTTEGSSTQGAYDTRTFPYGTRRSFSPADLPIGRNQGARYFIPSDDEWYKAGHFDPKLVGRRYWDYPTQTNRPPVIDDANYQVGEELGEGPPFYVADVAAYSDRPGPWGTVQQGGNLWEWTEDWRSKGDGGCWRCDEWTRGLRGGSYNYTWRGLHSGNVDPGTPDQAYFVMGARLARAVEASGWQPPAEAPTADRITALAKDYKYLAAAAALLAAFGFGVIAAISLSRRRGVSKLTR